MTEGNMLWAWEDTAHEIRRMIREPELPTRHYTTALMDSARWSAFQPRAGDIVVVTPAKSGTTWTQGILAMLIAGDPETDAQTSLKSPWIDIAVRPLDEVIARLEAQQHRRQVKTHTPFDGIPVWPDLRYITVYRHPLDVFFSWERHVANMTRDVHKAAMADRDAAFAAFVAGDHHNGSSLGGIVEHFRATLSREPRENMLRLHYADMLHDLPDAVAKIAAHVGIEHPPALVARITDAARFDSMKANANRFTPSAGQDFWHDDKGFFDSAGTAKWAGKLSPAQLDAYDTRMAALLDPEERRWLEQGSRAAA
jgi:aryl sulfotransferase